MVRKISWGNQQVITFTDNKFEEQLKLMEQVGITDYTVEELPDYPVPTPPSTGWLGQDYTQQEFIEYFEEHMKLSGFVSSKNA